MLAVTFPRSDASTCSLITSRASGPSTGAVVVQGDLHGLLVIIRRHPWEVGHHADKIRASTLTPLESLASFAVFTTTSRDMSTSQRRCSARWAPHQFRYAELVLEIAGTRRQHPTFGADVGARVIFSRPLGRPAQESSAAAAAATGRT